MSWGQIVGHLLTSSLTRGMGLFLRSSGMLSMPKGVFPLRHRTKSSPLNKTRFKHFTVESFQLWLFTDPGLAHACLLGSQSCSRFWNTVSKVTGLAIRKPLNFTASMHTNWDETEVRKWAGFEIGWLSFCPARQRDLSNQSLWPLAMRAS